MMEFDSDAFAFFPTGEPKNSQVTQLFIFLGVVTRV